MNRNPRRKNGNARDKLRARHKAAGERCHICGQAIDYSLRNPDPYSYVLDEIIPIKYGGDPLSWDNTHAAHWWCNSVKGTHSLQWAQHKVAGLMARGEAPSTRHENESKIESSDWFGQGEVTPARPPRPPRAKCRFSPGVISTKGR